uniref:Serine/threonine-protein kinase ULK3 n=1 Tax=Ornithodoros moubata TaxID=6938 RepID=A0A1Z5LCL9_ORNMO
MEYCSGGDLHRYIRVHKRLRELVVRKFLQQLAKALQVLQHHNIAHMDLKPQNILLSSIRNPVLKLADFGFAQYLREGDKASSLRGSPLYMAPEMLLSNHYDHKVDLWSVGIIMYECFFGSAPYASPTFKEVAEKIKGDKASSLRGSPLYMAPEMLLNNHYDHKVDLWSVGIIMYECFFGSAPYASPTFKEVAEKIKTDKPIELPPSAAISDMCRDLLLKLLQRDPKKRIGFDDFFSHPFVDLEHLPSRESFEKGVGLVHKAIAADSSGKYREALQLYCQALQYLLPILHNETDMEKWKSLQAKISEYLQRAEILKSILKTNEPIVIDDNVNNCDDFEDICERYPPLRNALLLVNAAKKLAFANRLQEALKTYQDALDIAIKFMPNCKPEEREVLRREAEKWLEAAELVKSYMAMQSFEEANSTPMRTESSCSVQ